MDNTNISWLASYPKSGSTWVRMFLNAYITTFPLNINNPYQYVYKDSDAGLLQLLCPTDIKELSHSEQFAYRPAMLLNMLKLYKTKICLKTHNAKICVNGIQVIPTFLSDKAIYLVRDPRDVCISLSHHLDYTIDQTIEFMNNIKQGVSFVETNLTDLILTWSKHIESWVDKNTDLSYKVIKYEDMLSDPIYAFVQILRHLSLNTIEDAEYRFNFAMEQSSFENLQRLENTKGFVEKGRRGNFFRVGKAGQWKKDLSVEQIDKIIEDHGYMMEKYNYV
jgi:hypothetical protein